MKIWVTLAALLSASGDLAFRWPEGTVSAFARLIFWYLVFISCTLALMKALDRRHARQAATPEGSEAGR